MSINNEKTIICELFNKMFDKLLVGKKPPEEIIVIAKFSELNTLIFSMLRTIKIINVIKEYNKKILNDCFKVSALLKDIKFVNDFLKLLSNISINKIIENKKYKPPIHWAEDLHKIKLWSTFLIFSKMVNPVDVKPDTASKYELTKVKL